MPRLRPLQLTLAATLTLGTGLAASAALFYASSHLEYNNQTLAFEQRAAQRVAAVREGLSEAVEVANVTNQLFASVQHVSREQFHDFTLPLLKRHPFIKAFNYHRMLDDSERAAVEAELQKIRPGTVITEKLGAVQTPAPQRPHYSIVYYLEPMAGNEPALGVNAGAYPTLTEAVARAEATGQAAASDLLDLAQDSTPQASFEFVVPVHSPDGKLIGDTATVIRGHELVHNILASTGLLEDPGIHLAVYAGERPDPARLIFSTAPAGSALPRDRMAAWVAPDYTGRLERSFAVAGRNWLVQATAVPRPFLPDHFGSVSMLVGGILFTLLMTAFVEATTQRARKVQQLVRDRTADLKRTNLRLVEDVIARRRKASSASASWWPCRPTGTGSRTATTASPASQATSRARPESRSTACSARRAGRPCRTSTRPRKAATTSPACARTSRSRISNTSRSTTRAKRAGSASTAPRCSTTPTPSWATAALAPTSPRASSPSSASTTSPSTTC
jgi:CHASE1-domain containing sensor protein